MIDGGQQDRRPEGAKTLSGDRLRIDIRNQIGRHLQKTLLLRLGARSCGSALPSCYDEVGDDGKSRELRDRFGVIGGANRVIEAFEKESQGDAADETPKESKDESRAASLEGWGKEECLRGQ